MSDDCALEHVPLPDAGLALELWRDGDEPPALVHEAVDLGVGEHRQFTGVVAVREHSRLVEVLQGRRVIETERRVLEVRDRTLDLRCDGTSTDTTCRVIPANVCASSLRRDSASR